MRLRNSVLLLMAFQLSVFYPCQSQDPDSTPVLLKVLINQQMEIMQKLQDVQTRMLHLEEMTTSMSSKEQCASRDQVAEFQDKFTREMTTSMSSMVAEFQDKFTREMTTSMSSMEQCASRDQVAEFQDKFTREMNTSMSSMGQCASRDQVAEIQDKFTRDECKDKSHNCSLLATCQDLLVNYDCKCFEGYEGDGFTCEDINECESGTHSCQPNVTCVNTIGNFTCQCKGFNGRFYEGHCCRWPYSYLPGVGCLYLETKRLNWEAAQRNCETTHGKLYEAETVEEYMILAELFKATYVDYFIIVGVSGGKWVSSGKTVAKEIWQHGHPNSGDNAPGYMYMHRSFLLYDTNSELPTTSLCQMPM